MSDLTDALCSQVQMAATQSRPLRIIGGATKDFLAETLQGEPLLVTEHRGIINYDPRELVLTARAGTPLAELEAILAKNGQMLPFEPPHFGKNATLGGTIACGLSGPRRPYMGAARDFVLGLRLLNGQGQVLRFGGEVMKNVAGYDVSRLMVGAMGTLGVLLDISLKILPQPEKSVTLSQTCTVEQAIERMNTWAGKPFPLSAACYHGKQCVIRLSGAAAAVDEAVGIIGGDLLSDTTSFWQCLREHQHEFFKAPLWRLSVPPATPMLDLSGDWLLDWGGAQRWLVSATDSGTIRETVSAVNGHATLFRAHSPQPGRFHPLSSTVLGVHQQLKHAFDPNGVFNPGRMYDEF